MDTNFNKILSFILGLVVVVVFLAIVTGRLSLGRLPFFARRPTAVSPTITPTKTPSLTETVIPTTPKETVSITRFQTPAPGTIPSTGSPTILLPIIFSGFAGGLFLKRTGKK